MSSNMEDSDVNTRVTRGSLRRMASNESLNETEGRADTPRVLRVLGTISENASLPRRNRRNSDNAAAAVLSPFRRTTRASSQDKDVSASPLTTRNRRSIVDSDADDASATPVPAKSTQKLRKSMLVTSTIDLIEEESEEETDVKNESVISGSSLKVSVDELELRNRSISKSPNINGSPKKSTNSSLNEVEEMQEENGILDETVLEELPQKIYKSRNERNTEIPTSSEQVLEEADECSNELSPIKKFSNKRQPTQTSKTTFADIIHKIQKNSDEKSQTDDVDAQYSETDEEQVAKLVERIDEALGNSPMQTPVRKRRSIHGEQLSESSSIDIAPEKSVTPKQKTEKTPKKSPLKKEHVTDAPEEIAKAKTPKSSKKSEKSPKQTPAKTAYVQDKESELLDLVPDVATVKTPKSSKKAEKSPKRTPTSSGPIQDEVSKFLEDFVPDSTAVKTPKSSKKAEKSPKQTPAKSTVVNGNQTTFATQDMEISKLDDSNMEIVSTPSPSVPDKSVNSESSASKLVLRNVTPQIVQKSEPEPATIIQRGTHSLSSYLEQVSSIFKRRSHNPAALGSDEETDKASEKDKLSNSWSQSVAKSAVDTIDKINSNFTQPKTVKASPAVFPAQHTLKSISSDESEDEENERNLFIDDEAEVGSTDSITPSELQYLQENAISEKGESIGSQDTNEIDSGEEEEEEDGSFIDDQAISDNYSMDSFELRMEKSLMKSKRRSRILIQSDSSDDQQKVEKEKSPVKSQKSPDEKISQQPSARKNKLKRKREEEIDADESIVLKSKRAKISVDIPISETDALVDKESSDEETSSDDEVSIQKEAVKPKKSTGSVGIESVLNKCNELMGAYNESKRLKMALKREKKAQKLLAKKQEEAASLPKPEGMDSSNGSNKENVLKKKKKPKAKKQKLVDEMPERKEDMATSVSKLQEKLELKRQRKLEKKLAKQQRDPVDSESPKATVEAVADNPQKPEKKAKKQKQEQQSTVPELSSSSEKPKKKKKNVEVEKAAADELCVPEVNKPKTKKKHLQEVQENGNENDVDAKNLVKKKKKDKEIEPVEEPEPALEVPEKKKSKKRKIADVHVDEEDDVPKPKKKLNVLMQIEDPSQFQGRSRSAERTANTMQSQEQNFLVPLASNKLKKVIPPKLEDAKKKRKKNKAGKRIIAEPPTSLPRPVWTTSGVFIEAPISPYKFQSTKYVPISADSATRFGVVTFEGKQKKKQTAQQQQPIDFKSQAMFRNMKARDGSSKNIRGLLGSRNH